MDTLDLTKLYIDDSNKETTGADAVRWEKMVIDIMRCRLYAPTFEMLRANVLEPMRRYKYDETEVVALLGICLWDTGG